jgi:hypothetical protein
MSCGSCSEKTKQGVAAAIGSPVATGAAAQGQRGDGKKRCSCGRFMADDRPCDNPVHAAFESSELLNLFEVARVALADERAFDFIAGQMDLSDDALNNVRDQLNGCLWGKSRLDMQFDDGDTTYTLEVARLALGDDDILPYVVGEMDLSEEAVGRLSDKLGEYMGETGKEGDSASEDEGKYTAICIECGEFRPLNEADFCEECSRKMEREWEIEHEIAPLMELMAGVGRVRAISDDDLRAIAARAAAKELAASWVDALHDGTPLEILAKDVDLVVEQLQAWKRNVLTGLDSDGKRPVRKQADKVERGNFTEPWFPTTAPVTTDEPTGKVERGEFADPWLE